MAFEFGVVPDGVAYSLCPLVFIIECSDVADPYIRSICTISENTGTDASPEWTPRVSVEEHFRPGSTKYFFQLNEYMHDVINTYDIPALASNTPFLITKNARSFKLSFIEYTTIDAVYGDPLEFEIYMVHGGVDNNMFAKHGNPFSFYWNSGSRFLTWLKSNTVVNLMQPYSYLTWYNNSAEDIGDIKVFGKIKVRDTSGVESLIDFSRTFSGVNININRLLCVPCSFSQLGLSAEADPSTYYILNYYVSLSKTDNTVLADPFYFKIDQRTWAAERYFLYLSSVGALEVLRCTGKAISRKSDFTGSIAEKDISFFADDSGTPVYDSNRPQIVEYDLSSRRNIKISTGQKTRHEVNLFEDFRLSPFKYEILPAQNLMQIYLDEKSIDYGPDEDSTPSITFTYKYGEAVRAFTPDNFRLA